jgi:thiamine-monophosphate kinase
MDTGEFGYIRWIRDQQRTAATGLPLLAGGARVTVGPGDDCAVLDLPGAEASGPLLITTDMLLEGAHFERPAATPEQIGYKLAAVSYSDIAAMGGLPLVVVAAVGFDPAPDEELKAGLIAGINRAGEAVGAQLIGGDVTAWRTPPPPVSGGRLALSLTAIGTMAGLRPVLRSGARPGDVIVVTGELGGSLLGRHLTPVPRVAVGRFLAERGGTTAMIDVSDGIASDLGHIASESGVSVQIEAGLVPISPAARQAAARDGRPALDHALSDGEDFELLATISPAAAADLPPVAPDGTRLTRIGMVNAPTPAAPAGSIRLRQPDGRSHSLTRGGWDHLGPAG